MNKATRCKQQEVCADTSNNASQKNSAYLSRKTLNNKTLSGIAVISASLLFAACSGGGFETSGSQTALDDETTDNISICADRLGRSREDLVKEIKSLTGKDTFTVVTNPTGIDAENLTWDSNDVDVICTEDTNDIYSFNLINIVNEGQVIYGSQGTEYIGTIKGGTVFGYDGQDIVANLEGGTFYGGNDGDLIDTPTEHGLYTGWTYTTVDSDGLSGGEFYGEDGDDFVAQLYNGNFYGESGQDSVATLINGKFHGGDDTDSVTDPYFGNSGEMYGGEFHGDAGNDIADNVNGGKVFGGAGDDLVQHLSSATFDGMDGNDTVYSLNEDAVFSGGANDDLVDSMSGGTFDGGEGVDEVGTYFDGELIDVE